MGTTRHRDGRSLCWTASAALVCLAAGATPVLADGTSRVWLSAGLLGGSTLLDDRFAAFQWDVRPRPAWGAELFAGRGPWALGARAWRATSTQSIGQPEAPSADVALTTLEVVGARRLVVLLGTDLLATAGVGRLWLGYRPDQVTITSAGSPPIVVDLAPVHAWVAGAGLALRRPWFGPWNVSLAVDTQRFELETARSDGNAVVTERQSFGEWSARLGLSWMSRRP